MPSQIERTLEEYGVNWRAIPEGFRQEAEGILLNKLGIQGFTVEIPAELANKFEQIRRNLHSLSKIIGTNIGISIIYVLYPDKFYRGVGKNFEDQLDSALITRIELLASQHGLPIPKRDSGPSLPLS